jgi:hypothetical protein
MRADWSLIIFVVVIVLLIWFVMRGRRGRESPRLQVAIALTASVNDNLRIIETHRIDPGSTKKFKESAWKSYGEKLDFLDVPTVTALKESYTLIAEINATIDSAKRDKNTAILQGLPLEKLKDPLARSKDGLVLWLRANLQSEMRHSKGPFGF